MENYTPFSLYMLSVISRGAAVTLFVVAAFILLMVITVAVFTFLKLRNNPFALKLDMKFKAFVKKLYCGFKKSGKKMKVTSVDNIADETSQHKIEEVENNNVNIEDGTTEKTDKNENTVLCMQNQAFEGLTQDEEKPVVAEKLIWKVEEIAKLYVADDDAVILKRSMNNKLKFADDDIKQFYNTIKNALMSYKGVKTRMSNVSENFRLKRELLAKITLAGANLKIFLALDVDSLPQNIYHQKDMGNMDLYINVPFMVKIKTPLAARKACFLIGEVMKKFGLVKNPKYIEQDYITDLVPEVNEALAKSRSVITLREAEVVHIPRVLAAAEKVHKELAVEEEKVRKEEAYEEENDLDFDDGENFVKNENIIKTEPSISKDEITKKTEEMLIWKVDEVAKLYVADDDAVILKRSMNNKLKFADDDIKDFYNTIKNALMSYKGVKSRMSNVSENFRLKRELLAKITLAGANLKIFLAIDIDSLPQNIYHQKNMGNMDLYINVPFMVKIKTPLAARKACFLIGEVMKKFGLVKNPKYLQQDYIAELIPEENEILAKSRSVITLREGEVIGKMRESKNIGFANVAADVDEESQNITIKKQTKKVKK
ncbi:MAG: hypothetical protein PHE93_02760 [Clostridia bacterium]|nr:hypothetical protein [Clostridia bacterium]